MSNTLDIKLLGKDYRVACDPADRASLSAAVAYLDTKLNEIGTKTRSNGERLAVMAALNIAHELLAMKNTSPDDAAQAETAAILARINSIEAKLDESLADHGQTS